MRNSIYLPVALLFCVTSWTSAAEPTYPPTLPDGAAFATDSSPKMLQPPASLQAGVKVATTAPKIDFAYFPGQDYPGKPWSNWGDSLAVGDKYYASIGDHLAPAGNAFVYEYDSASRKFRKLLDLKKLLKLPEGHYAPGKIHSRLDLGADGWLYCSTHRGSTKVTTDQYHYKGDWIVRVNVKTGESEIVAQGVVPKHCVPTSVLDGQRNIFYGGTAPGSDSDPLGIQFFAYDVKQHKLLYSGADGPPRYMILANSTGRVYYTAGKEDNGALMRFDPASNQPPQKIPGEIGIRAATQETAQHVVYSVSQGRKGAEATIYAFHTDTEKIESLGPAAVGGEGYITSLDVDPTGRYLYYIPGAHGGSERDNSAVVQFDTKTRMRKVLAFLHPYYAEKYGATLKGTYSSAVSGDGSKLFITWNVSRGSKAWDSCALTVIHIPESERTP
ncbi:MAG TPA: hypothetical protein VL096_17260 [Pirellulaceae bacterium]|nr:hypothetical protein [Pirellulaceae bacterium]